MLSIVRQKWNTIIKSCVFSQLLLVDGLFLLMNRLQISYIEWVDRNLFGNEERRGNCMFVPKNLCKETCSQNRHRPPIVFGLWRKFFLLKRSCVSAEISIVVLLITRALLPLHRLTLDVMHSKRNNAASVGLNGCKVTASLII